MAMTSPDSLLERMDILLAAIRDQQALPPFQEASQGPDTSPDRRAIRALQALGLATRNRQQATGWAITPKGRLHLSLTGY